MVISFIHKYVDINNKSIDAYKEIFLNVNNEDQAFLEAKLLWRKKVDKNKKNREKQMKI